MGEIGARHRVVAVDTGVAVLLYVLLVASLLSFASLLAQPDGTAPEFRWLGWEGYVAGAVVTLPLAVRRRAPVAVLAVVTAGLCYFRWLGGGTQLPFWIALFLAIFSVGAHGRPVVRDVARALAVAALLGLSVWLVGFVEQPGRPPQLRVVNLLNQASEGVIYGAAWVLGNQWRLRRDREHQLAERTVELEIERERSAEQAAMQERLRIARELHDVVGHHVSVVGLQAAGARRVLRRDLDRAEEVLEGIEVSSREALADLQQVLELLRDEHESERRVRPDLGRLGVLADEVRNAGVDVVLDVDDLPEMPASVHLAASRVIQEALTNVCRHAGPGTSALVRVRAGSGVLHVSVEDDGRGAAKRVTAAAGGAGRGLAGLRERVELHQGRFDAGHQPGGGFRVTASLPTA